MNYGVKSLSSGMHAIDLFSAHSPSTERAILLLQPLLPPTATANRKILLAHGIFHITPKNR